MPIRVYIAYVARGCITNKPNGEWWKQNTLLQHINNSNIIIMISRQYIASELYRVYCEAVGGLDFNGNPLPNWEDFSSDPNKKKQSDAWLVSADRAMQLLMD